MALPVWVFHQDEGCVIGVSDPYLKEQVALEQAIQRALFAYVLTQGVQINLVADYFSSSRTEYEYEKSALKIMKLLMADMSLESYDYQVKDKYISSCGEYFIQLKVLCQPIYGMWKSRLEMMESVEEELRHEGHRKIILTTYSSGQTGIYETYFSFKGNEDRMQLESALNGKKCSIPDWGYWYKDHIGSPEEPVVRYEGDLKHAFWNAWMNALLKGLVMYNYNEMLLQTARDGWENEKQDFHVRQLTREIVREKVVVKQQYSSIRNNKLVINWNISSK